MNDIWYIIDRMYIRAQFKIVLDELKKIVYQLKSQAEYNIQIQDGWKWDHYWPKFTFDDEYKYLKEVEHVKNTFCWACHDYDAHICNNCTLADHTWGHVWNQFLIYDFIGNPKYGRRIMLKHDFEYCYYVDSPVQIISLHPGHYRSGFLDDEAEIHRLNYANMA